MASPVALAPALGLPGIAGQLAAGPLGLQLTYAGPRSGLLDPAIHDLRHDIAGESGGDVQKHLGNGKAR